MTPLFASLPRSSLIGVTLHSPEKVMDGKRRRHKRQLIKV
jgi:hypothetical protein